MPTQDEKNLALNKFMGWEPNQRCHGLGNYHDNPALRCKHRIYVEHDIPPFDYYADTPEARERVRLLRYEFVKRTHKQIQLSWDWNIGNVWTEVWIAGVGMERACKSAIESHAILDAIYEAIR